MKVLWLSSEPMVRGALGVTGRFEAIRHLRSRGMDVHVLCGAEAGAVPLEGVPTTFLPTRYLPFLSWLSQWPALSRELKRQGTHADVVVSDFALLPPLVRFVRRQRRRGRPVPGVLLDIRSHPVEAGRVRNVVQNQRFDWTLRLSGRHLDGVAVVSDALRGRASRLTRIPEASIEVWRAGCRWCDEDLGPQPWPAELPDELRERFVVFYHGSITPGRGLSASVEALAMLRTQVPDLVLVLLGRGWAIPQLEELAQRSGIRERLVIVPPVPHERVPEFLAAGDVGLVPLPPGPAWDVNFPVKLTEYLCARLPVVLTDIEPHRIVPREEPFVFWGGDGRPERLAGALLEASAARGDLRRRGELARAWAVPRLGWRPQADVLERMLRATTSEQVR